MKQVIWIAILMSWIAVAQTRTDMFNQKPNFKAMKTIEKAKKLIDKGKLRSAEEKLRGIVEEPGFEYQALGYLAIIEDLQGDSESAIELFQESIVKFLDHKNHVIARKKEYLKSMEQEAISEKNLLGTRKMAYANRIPVQSKGVLGSTSTRYVSQGNPALVESVNKEQFDRVEQLKIQLEKDKEMAYPAFFYFKLGNILFKANQFEYAQMTYLNAVSSDEAFPDVYPNLAVTYFLANDCENASKMVARAETLGAEVNPGFKRDLARRCP